MMKDLRDAGFIFIFYNSLSIIFTFITIILIFFRIKNSRNIVRDPNCCVKCDNWIGYSFPVTGFLLHTCGLAIWMNITDTKFESWDDVSRNERSRLCADVGPILEILALLLYFVMITKLICCLVTLIL